MSWELPRRLNDRSKGTFGFFIGSMTACSPCCAALRVGGAEEQASAAISLLEAQHSLLASSSASTQLLGQPGPVALPRRELARTRPTIRPTKIADPAGRGLSSRVRVAQDGARALALIGIIILAGFPGGMGQANA